MDYGFSYNFPALRGKQGGKEYFVVMCPLRLIPKIFLFDEEEIPAEHRAQRILNKIRIPEITNYIIENQNDYVFSSLTASIDGDIEFQPFSSDQSFQDLGQLRISLDSKFLINDGQHRRAAIEEAIKLSPELGHETISVVFYHDQGLRNSQQIFSDLNRHAVNTTSSIGILYDHRDKLALVTKEIVEENNLLVRYTDKEKVNLSKNSPKILALNHIFNTNLRLLGKTKGDLITENEEQFLKEFWNILCDTIVEWNLVYKKELSPRELRMNYIVGHGVFIESVGLIGRYAFENYPHDWKKYISLLSNIDYSRSNTSDWLGRAFNTNGRIQKTKETVTLTANKLKEKLGLSLTEGEQKIEEKFQLGA
ncbi:DNA sulfur modification protein DndB [Bacillus thuringiensis]|uniref:DNA sulfur modification protein DndB n=1 Tax=Bacillus thuringiensis TaxID=1428 RepID=UPI000BF9C5D7|nr:DNA sulfur modification protein DndB [Bacillus thuringiensis]PFV92843.1 DNA sulfur modification protein DndB [Bacillus thuringiensis]PGQ47314.1 DNA sulfur modification protein DndB [Bacillus thuringiensis]PGR92728.1 DNA sulfur modification protein DndB [Bacillus thuringiensis]